MSVQLSVRDPLLDAQENILGTLNILQAAAQVRTPKFIFASTGGAIYGDQAQVPARETDPPRPESPYGIAKLSVEHYLHFFHQEHGVPHPASGGHGLLKFIKKLPYRGKGR
jgi:UDP-glucose 4-epimerase